MTTRASNSTPKLVLGLVLISAITVACAAALTLMGRPTAQGPIIALGAWFSLLFLVRPYVYERFGSRTADLIVIVLVLGPFAVFALPLVLWSRGRGD